MRKLVLFVIFLIISLSGLTAETPGFTDSLTFYAKKTANPVLPPYTVTINNLYKMVDNISEVSNLEEIGLDVADLKNTFQQYWDNGVNYNPFALFEVIIAVDENIKGTGSINLNVQINSFNSSKLHIEWIITEEYFNFSQQSESGSKNTEDSVFSNTYPVYFSEGSGNSVKYLKSYKIKFSIAEGEANFNYSDLKYNRTDRIIVNVSISGA